MRLVCSPLADQQLQAIKVVHANFLEISRSISLLQNSKKFASFKSEVRQTRKYVILISVKNDDQGKACAVIEAIVTKATFVPRSERPLTESDLLKLSDSIRNRMSRRIGGWFDTLRRTKVDSMGISLRTRTYTYGEHGVLSEALLRKYK